MARQLMHCKWNCGYETYSRIQMARHYKKCCNKPQPKMKKGQESRRVRHQNYPCRYCGNRYTTKAMMKKHRRNVHGK